MLIENTYRYKDAVEVERVHSGRYGKRIPNGKRRNPTSEGQRRVNERNAARKLRRKIYANFSDNDLFITLAYRDGAGPEAEEARGLLMKFLKQCRGIWKEEGTPFKYIAVTGRRGGEIRHHIIAGGLRDGSGAGRITECWEKNGRAHTERLYGAGGYEKLAEYLMKETGEAFREPDAPCKARYSCSKNLVDPEKETRVLAQEEKAAGEPAGLPPEGKAAAGQREGRRGSHGAEAEAGTYVLQRVPAVRREP